MESRAAAARTLLPAPSGEFHSLLAMGADVCGHPCTVHGGFTSAVIDETTGREQCAACCPCCLLFLSCGCSVVSQPALLLAWMWHAWPAKGWASLAFVGGKHWLKLHAGPPSPPWLQAVWSSA